MKTRLVIGFTVGFFIGLPWLALISVGQQVLNTPHIPFELFEFLTRILPGGTISLGIEGLIELVTFFGLGQTSATGKMIEIFAAYLLALALLSLFGALFAITLQKLRTSWWIKGIFAGLILTISTMLLVDLGSWGSAIFAVRFGWLLITGLAWGISISWGVNDPPATSCVSDWGLSQRLKPMDKPVITKEPAASSPSILFLVGSAGS